jgi:hypothetical protein
VPISIVLVTLLSFLSIPLLSTPLLSIPLLPLQRYHVFVSYRVWCDKENAKKLTESLKSEYVGMVTPESCAVFLDQDQLKDGTNWEESFCFALANSLIFCCIVSKLCWTSFVEFDDSGVDNVLLEYLLAFELAAIKKLQIFPLFVVENNSSTAAGVFFPSEILPKIPDIVPTQTIQRANEHLHRMGFAPSITADATLPVLLGRMLTFQGMVTDFEADAHQCTVRVSTAVSSVLAGKPAASIISKELRSRSNTNILDSIIGADASDLRNMNGLVSSLGHMMDANMHEGDLVADCVKKLREAADKSEQHRAIVSTEYVVALAIEAARFHLQESGVVLECATLLRRCARCSFTSLIISRIGGVAVVVQCAEVHMENESIVEQCLYLLRNIGMVAALVPELREHCVGDVVRVALTKHATNRSLTVTATQIRKTLLFAGGGDAATVIDALKPDAEVHMVRPASGAQLIACLIFLFHILPSRTRSSSLHVPSGCGCTRRVARSIAIRSRMQRTGWCRCWAR